MYQQEAQIKRVELGLDSHFQRELRHLKWPLAHCAKLLPAPEIYILNQHSLLRPRALQLVGRLGDTCSKWIHENIR